MPKPSPKGREHIAAPGYLLILASVVLVFLGLIGKWLWLTVLGLVGTGFFSYFLRYPERLIPLEPGLIVNNMPIMNQWNNFLKRNMREIRDGGAIIFFAKAYQLLFRIVLLPIFLIIRLLSPLINIRFGQLCSERLGHYAFNTEMYLCERDLGMQPKNTIDIFFNTPVCNDQLAKMWKRILHISSIAKDLYWLCDHLPGGEKHCVRFPSDMDLNGLLIQTKVHLSFTENEEDIGREALRKMGIPDNMPFVCFHARDNEYLNVKYPKADWRYHDYRDSNICNYLPAMEELTRRGYFALRMGSVVKEELKINNPYIIDYATQFRTDFLDIYLSSKCKLFIGNPCGLIALPVIFRRPIVFVNYIPLEYVAGWHPSYIIIFKKLWINKENRLMTFREIIESGAGRFLEKADYDKNGITPIENTPEEIKSAVIEMDERLKGNYQAFEDEEELQKSFWSLFKASDLNHIFVSRIGANYLRQNRDLIR